MRTKLRLFLASVALAVWLAVPHPAAAVGSCAFNSAVGVSFGAYNVFDPSPIDSTGSITYTCVSLLAPITIDLSKGVGSGYSPRRMHKGGDNLSYNLYLDASRVTVWGNGTGGSSRYGPVTPPLGSPVTVTIYGRMPARQNVRAGSYTDTITATINF
jgi:spore coat protein U-like protein